MTINVSLTTTAAGQPSLSIKPPALTFAFVKGGAASSQSISVANAGGGSLSFSVAATTASGGSWLSASPASGTVGAYGSSAVSITANPASLAPGTYSGTVVVSSANPVQSAVIPVTMTVSAVLQTILIPQTGLTFLAVQGGGPAPPQFFSILNTGTGQMTFNISGGTLSGGAWLSAFPFSGESDASSSIVPQIRVGADPGNLTAGIYYGSIQVSSSGANNSPQSVSVILNVLPPGTNIGPLVQPAGLIYSGIAGGPLQSSQTILVQNTNGNSLNFHSGEVTTNGIPWPAPACGPRPASGMRPGGGPSAGRGRRGPGVAGRGGSTPRIPGDPGSVAGAWRWVITPAPCSSSWVPNSVTPSPGPTR